MVLWVSGRDMVHDLEVHVLRQGPAAHWHTKLTSMVLLKVLEPPSLRTWGLQSWFITGAPKPLVCPEWGSPELPSSSLQLHPGCQQRASFCPSQMWYHDLWRSFFNAQIFPFLASRSPLRLTLVSYYRHDSRNLWWLALSDIGICPRFISCLRQIYWFEFSREQSIGDR